MVHRISLHTILHFLISNAMILSVEPLLSQLPCKWSIRSSSTLCRYACTRPIIQGAGVGCLYETGISKWALRCYNGGHPRAHLIWRAASFDLAALVHHPRIPCLPARICDPNWRVYSLMIRALCSLSFSLFCKWVIQRCSCSVFNLECDEAWWSLFCSRRMVSSFCYQKSF